MVIAVFGAKGRVGKRVCEIAQKRGHVVVEFDCENRTIEGRSDKAKPTQRDAVEPNAWLNCAIIEKNEQKIDVAIDFSTASATKEVCEFCALHRCPLVTGTTGRNAVEQEEIEKLKAIVKVSQKANFSRGMQLVEKICEMLAPYNFDCDVIETHRKGKTDSPSGTAKQLYKTLLMGGTRTVCVHSVRSGSNFGKHEIIFGTQGESITITHQAENVDIFAQGALDEAEKIVKTQNDF